MIIGWLCKGYTHLNVKSVDGMLNIRVPLLNMLLKKHNIIWLGHQRPKRLLNDNMFYKPIVKEYLDAYKRFEKSYIGEKKVATFFTSFRPQEFPELDILLVEISRIHVYAPLFASVIDYYNNYTKTKIILWDTDRWLNDFAHWLRPFPNSDLTDFKIFAPYKGNKEYAPYLGPEWYNMAPFPYDRTKELEITTKPYDLCYIGNDYRRRPKMEKYYNFPFADVYGKYDDDEWKATMKCNFRGRTKPDEVREIYNQYSFCVQIVKKDYEKFGLMTPRINEVLEAGTLILVDGDIITASLFVDEEYIVHDTEDVLKWKERLDKMTSEEYKKRVMSQRKKVASFCSYDSLLSIFSLDQGHELVKGNIKLGQQKSMTDFF